MCSPRVGVEPRTSRRLVLNGLTAEVRGEGTAPDADGYHELELVRQLLALPERSDEGTNRTRTPSPITVHDEQRETCSSLAHTRPARYLGSFPAEEEVIEGRTVSSQLHLVKKCALAEPVVVVIAISGVQVCNPQDQSVRMSHALRRISYATCEAARALFAFVARDPRSKQAQAHALQCELESQQREERIRQYCYAFETDTPEQAEELNTLVGDAFRMAFASQLHPSAPPAPPLWNKELSECGMGVRAPDSLPGLQRHLYPRCQSPSKCDNMGMQVTLAESSPSSSEESASPTEVNCYRRLGDRPPLMRRLALGFSGALLNPSDDDATPLVTDTPTTPTNLPLCLNGGYINEATECEARTRDSNRQLPRRIDSVPSQPVTPARNRNDAHVRNCNDLNNCRSSPVRSRGTSSSGSSSGVATCSLNNNPRFEPELQHAPWFQHGIPREIALEVLSAQGVGSFLVRGSTTQPACYALSVRVPRDFQPSGIAHYLILRTTKGYKIKGFTKEFTSLTSLVTHHSVMPELLPVPLRLVRSVGMLPPGSGPQGSGPQGSAFPPRHRRERDMDHADIDAVAQHTTPQHVHSYLTQLDV